MANSYQWAINSLTAYPEHAGQTDVVFQIAYVCSGTDGTYHAASYGSVDVAYEPGQPFTPFAELTLEQVVSWVHGALGPEGIAKATDECDAAIAAQQAVPASVTPPLPWNVPTPAPEPEPEQDAA